MLGIIYPGAADITLRVKTVQYNRTVIVLEGPDSISQKQVRGSAVEISVRILRLTHDESVKILHGLLKLLREKVSHSTAEIQSIIARSQIYRASQIFQSPVIFPHPAERYRSVMVCQGIDRVEFNGLVKIRFSTSEIP